MPSLQNANIATLLTPTGIGAIAVIRLSGPALASFFQTHFTKPLVQSKCVHGQLRDDEKTIDDAVAVLIDPITVDLCLHGGSWVVKAALDLALSAGFEIQDEILNAVDADNILEREMLAALPLARTELALRALLAQPQAWASSTINAAEILKDLSLWHLLHPPQVAIVGVPNVGKSTLANQLFAQERSITADLPGTTRDWVGETANLDGLAITLVDTPGIRSTPDYIEREAIAKSAEVIKQSDLVIVVLDASRPLAGEQQALIDRWPDAIRVVNQIDRPHAWDVREIQAIHTVATRGEGIDQLGQQIREHFGVDDLEISRPRFWTMRQRELLSQNRCDLIIASKDPRSLAQ